MSPIERLLRNVIALERIANTISAESAARYQQLFEAIVADLIRIDPTGPGQGTYRRLRTDKFLKAVQERIREFAPAEVAALKDRLAVVGRMQGKFAEGTLIASLGEVGARRVNLTPITQQRVRAILNSEPFMGRLMGEHVNRVGANVFVRVRDQVRIGMLNEESIPDIVRRVRGRRVGFIRQDPKTGAFVSRGTRGAVVTPRFSGGVLNATTRETEALVRTAVNFVSNRGLEATYDANASVIEALEFTAFLDDRTTEICLSLDGNRYALDESRPPLPLHYNERSQYVPVPAWDKLGLTPPDEPVRVVRDLSEVSDKDLARRVSARRRTGDLGGIERVPATVRATEWLRGQPVRVQEKLLGKGKARLFREGKISLPDLIRRDMTTVPLSELQVA